MFQAVDACVLVTGADRKNMPLEHNFDSTMKITELREKYKTYLPMIYEKLGDKIHTTALKARMEADGFEYAMSEIQSIRQNWAPLDGSPPGFVLDHPSLSSDCSQSVSSS